MQRKLYRLWLLIPMVGLSILANLQHSRAALPDESNQLQSIVFLSNHIAFVQEWRSLPTDASPHIKALKKAKANQPLYLGMVAYVPPAMSGKRTLTIGLRLIGPDGKVLIDLPNYVEFETDVPPSGGYVLIEPPFDLQLKDTDLAGNYTAYAQVTDKATNIPAYGNYAFQIEK